MKPTIQLGDESYTQGFTFPPNAGSDHTSESYEWVKGTETVENWTTLLTTHKLSPLQADTPLSAEAYAQNVVAMNTSKGAIILETSVINNEDAAKEGIDISNPPYLIVYAFLPTNPSGSLELGIQKIENIGEGRVAAFIYGEKIGITTEAELQEMISTPEYFKKRSDVILTRFPY